MRVYILLSFCLAGLMYTVHAGDYEQISFGDDREVSSEGLSLEEIFKITLKSGSFLELDLHKSPISMTIIKSVQIQASGARNLSDLLEIYVPGFQYDYNPWNGKIWGMRGVINDRNTKILVLVNGHKLNAESRDGFIYEQSLGLMDDLERIEVLRGPAGFVYGSGAIAGIINMITKKDESNGGSASISKGTDGSTVIDSRINIAPDEHQYIGIDFGVKYSEGIGRGSGRLYGKSNWPVPVDHEYVNEADLIRTGIPVHGSYGSTPGNIRLAGTWNWNNLEVYTRFTRQDESGSPLFPYCPWPESQQWPSAYDNGVTLNPVIIDGKKVYGDDPFWAYVEGWGNERRHYLNDNFSLSAQYAIPMAEKDELKLKASFDMTSNTIYTGVTEENTYEWMDYQNEFEVEAFGEKRVSFGLLYLLNSIDKLKSAFGIDVRADDFGEDFNGNNRNNMTDGYFVVYDTTYNTVSLFLESIYEIGPLLSIHGGLRFDKHTKANMFNWKGALITAPSENHVYKLIYQTSSNNGSVDNYEYNRTSYNSDGSLRTEEDMLADLAILRRERPRTYTPVISREELNAINPEKVYTCEVIAHDQWKNVIFTESFTYGMVRDLLQWEQNVIARVVNADGYDYINFDFEIAYASKYVDVGVSHTFQKPIIKETSGKQYFRNSLNIDSTYNVVDSVWEYNATLSATEYDTVDVSGLAPISTDNEYFQNLNTHISKMFIDYKPKRWVTLHADMRIFWGLQGRYDEMVDDINKGYLNLFIRTEDGSIITENSALNMYNAYKLNLSCLLQSTSGLNVGLYAYNVLGVDNAYGDYKQGSGIGNLANTLRWQNSSDSYFSFDQRSYAIKIMKVF